MNNKHSRITEERRLQLNTFMDELLKDAYNEGYEDGKAVLNSDLVEQHITQDGIKLRQVNRTTKTGDYVKFEKSPHHDTLQDKYYKVHTEHRYTDEKGANLAVHGWDIHHTGNVPVYEPITQPTPNQQRKALIEKARKFVEKELYDRMFGNISFVINSKKRTVVALKRNIVNGNVVQVTKAKCDPEDVFNEYIGQVIVLCRLIDKEIPKEFLEAVQPSEVVVGHTVTTKNSLQIYEVSAFHDSEHLGGDFGRAIAIEGVESDAWIGEKQVTITHDTHAEY